MDPLRIVFLDRDSLPATEHFTGPEAPHELVQYPRTAPEQVVERIRDADIVIVNKVVLAADAIDQAPRLRWRLLSGLCTWFFLGREAPLLDLPRGRALETGDPLFDLCREQSEAVGIGQEPAGARVVIATTLSAPDGERLVDALLAREGEDLRIDWIGAPPLGEREVQQRVRRLGALPHWRALALLRRSRILVTDDPLLAMEARWIGRTVFWIGASAVPRGCIEVPLPQLAGAVHQALAQTLSPRPLAEDGRAAPRLAAQLLDRVEQRAFAGWLTRVRPR